MFSTKVIVIIGTSELCNSSDKANSTILENFSHFNYAQYSSYQNTLISLLWKKIWKSMW